MSVSENIIMTAKNETKKALNEMEKDTRKTAGAMKKDFSDGAGTASKRVGDLGKGLNNTVQQLTGFNLAQLGAAGAVALVAKGVGASIRFTAEYAEEIRTLSAATGMNNQETAKMIQLFDDANVSQGALTQAARQLVRQGLQPSIETIADLADQYNALEDPVARSQLLLDNFGRAGLEMGKMLEMGSDAIRESGKAAERAGQVMSDDAVAGAEEYRVALDNLSDSAEGVKIKVGTELIPVLTRGANAINNWLEATAEHTDAFALLDEALSLGIITQSEYDEMVVTSAKGTRSLRDANVDLTGVQDKLNSLYQRSIPVIKDYKINTDDLAQSEEELKAAADRTAGVYDEAERALRESNIPHEEKIRLERELALASGETTAAELEMRRQVDILTLSLAAGAITQREYKTALGAMASGESTATATTGDLAHGMRNLATDAEAAAQKARSVKAAVDALKDKTITIKVKLVNVGGALGGSYGATGATGLDMTVPPGFPNDTFPVWTSSGESVKVTPPGKGSSDGGGGSVYIGKLIINPAPGMDEFELASEAVRQMENARAARLAGLDYAG